MEDWYRCATEPKSVAVVGASEAPGRSNYMVNLMRNNFGRTIYPVNPGRAAVFGLQSYPDLRSLPGEAEAVWMLVPAAATPAVANELQCCGARFVYVGAAGFAEVGEEGRELQRKLVDAAHRAGARVLGPNGNGLFKASSGFFGSGLTLAPDLAEFLRRDRSIAMISQSGAVGGAIQAIATDKRLPIDLLFATGNECDITLAELLEQVVEDDAISVVLLYLESIRDSGRFVRAARRARDLGKTIIALKTGLSEVGAKVALSHTAGVVGSGPTFLGICAQLGIIVARSPVQLVELARMTSRFGQADVRSVGVVTVSGGQAGLYADALAAGGFELPPWSAVDIESFRRRLPAYAGSGNPLDASGQLIATAEGFEDVVRAAHRSTATDATIVCLRPRRNQEAPLAERIVAVTEGSPKPMLVTWLGGARVAYELLDEAGVPCFEDIPPAAAVLRAIKAARARRSEPVRPAAPRRRLPQSSLGLLADAKAAGLGVVDEVNAKKIVASAGLDVPGELRLTAGPAGSAGSAGEQLRGSNLRLPVVAKIVSAGLAHKSDAGAVRMGLATLADVEAAVADLRTIAAGLHLESYDVILQEEVPRGTELLLGMKRDESFGAVLVIGHGGVLAEALADVAVAIPPLTPGDVSRLIATLGHPRLTAGFRGLPPADTEPVRAAVAAFSELILDLPEWVGSVDVNPLIAAPDGRAVAVDALFTL